MPPMYAKMFSLGRRIPKGSKRRSAVDNGRRWRLLWFLVCCAAIHLMHENLDDVVRASSSDRNDKLPSVSKNNMQNNPPVYTNVGVSKRLETMAKQTVVSQVFQSQREEDDTRQPPPHRKWAYAFLLGGVNAQADADYRGGLLGILAAAHSLRHHGSSPADIVVMIQMSAGSRERTLPAQEEALLKSVDNLYIHYLPRFKNASLERFYSLVLEKFRILQLDHYSRVMFVDNDILPKCNLDYLFELSEPKDETSRKDRLKSNVVLGYKDEPANAGLFLFQPNRSDFMRLQQIVLQKEQRALRQQSSPNHWDPVQGWGHVIQPPDHWSSPMGVTGTNWTWFAAFADQGLLYHWTKYVQHDVSLVYGNTVENIGGHRDSDSDGFVVESTRKGWLTEHSCSYDPSQKRGQQPAPYRDFVHFTGFGKPWWKDRAEMEQTMWTMKDKDVERSEWEDHLQWYWHLKAALKSFEAESPSVNRDTVKAMFDILGQKKEPPVGMASNFQQMFEYIMFKKINKWNQYEG